MKHYTLITLALLPGFLFAQDELRIALHPGHNLISSNLQMPEAFFRQGEARGPDIRQMMVQLRTPNGNFPVNLLNNESGLYYAPNRNFNNIPYWNISEGYMLWMTEAAELVWRGERMPVDAEVPLASGGNYISYLPDFELDASQPNFAALAPVIDHVNYAMDGDGNFMLPRFEFSNMPPWRAGQGYAVNVDRDLEFRYPAEGEGEPWQPLIGNHFARPSGGKHKMPVLVNAINGIGPTDGDMIAAYTPGNLYVGCGTVQNDKCGLAIWEAAGDQFAGIHQGEAFLLRYWQADGERLLETEIVNEIEGSATYEHFRVAVLEIEVNPDQPMAEQEIVFRAGWNLVSLNITPTDEYLNNNGEGYSLPVILGQLRPQQGAHHVLRVVDGMGHFWVPRLNFNDIPEWPLDEGLWVQTDIQATIRIPGYPRSAEDAIVLREGWNVIAYLPQEELEANAPDFPVIAPIRDHVLVAKDGLGKFLWPERNFSNMEQWQPGSGYVIKVDEEIEFRYPER